MPGELASWMWVAVSRSSNCGPCASYSAAVKELLFSYPYSETILSTIRPHYVDLKQVPQQQPSLSTRELHGGRSWPQALHAMHGHVRSNRHPEFRGQDGRGLFLLIGGASKAPLKGLRAPLKGLRAPLKGFGIVDKRQV